MTWSADSITITADGAPLTWTADGYLPSAVAFIALILPIVGPDLVLSHSSPVIISSVVDVDLAHDVVFAIRDEQTLYIGAS